MEALTKNSHETEKQEKRLEDAKQAFEEIQDKIAPFLKRRRIQRTSTLGKWRQTSTLQRAKPDRSSKS